MDPIRVTPLPPRYEMLGELGRGGMGIVYKAKDGETGEVLAIKVLKPEISANPQVLERFKNELLLAHKITHRNVARLYEFHRVGESVYVSMEYVEGESLRALLQRERKLEVERGIELARQIAGGLAEAHRQTIVHRDLKPENIMIAPDGSVKIMDFGISRSFAEDATVTGSVVGTPAYMAPEQAEGRALDQRTDIYAFGLILYEMFTGEAAFKGDTAVTVALKQVRERPTLPTALAPSLPKYIESAIMKCVEKDPAARFQSVDEVIQALDGTVAAPASRRTEAPERRKLPLAVIGAAAAVLVLVAVGWWWVGRPSDSVRFPIEQFKLPNGLEVALSPDHASPTLTLAVAYRAGLRRDTRERPGLAHLVQHAMYEGSPNVARGEYEELISEAGGNMDGTTSQDVALFWTTLPANQLDLALFLEADRMRTLEITQEGLEAARRSLLEERARALNIGYAAPILRFTGMAFDNFANQQSGYVTPDELKRLTIEDVREFYRKYYTPSNAGIVLVGDFDPAKAREQVQRFFAGIPARPAAAEPDIREPGRSAERRETAAVAGVPAPLLAVAWHAPATTNPDWFSLKRVGEVLGGGNSARLNNALVKTAGVAATVALGLDSSAGPNLVSLRVVMAPGKDPAQVIPIVDQEIEAIARDGVPKDEMERNETNALRRRAFQLVTTTIRAQVFAIVLVADRRLAEINDWEPAERRITNDDVKRVTRKYLTPATRTVLTVMTGAKP
jgi:predicted Zn-dependent peptidase